MSLRSDEFPKITTSRCTLRQILDTDQQKIFEGLSHPGVTRHYGVRYDSFDDTSVQMTFYDDLIRNETGIWWAVTDSGTGEFVGACGFNNRVKEHRRAEIGFWLLPPFEGRGLMHESVEAIVSYGFGSMRLHRIEAIVETGNDRSARLLEKLGFQFEGRHRECEIKDGRFIDLEFYALLESKVEFTGRRTSVRRPPE